MRRRDVPDDKCRWFCPECILEELDPGFLDENRTDPGDLQRSFCAAPSDKTGEHPDRDSRSGAGEDACQEKGDSQYQTYLKTLLHEALIKEESGTYLPVRPKSSRRNKPR